MDAKAPAPNEQPGDSGLAAREAAYEAFVWDNLRRNYLGNYMHGMLGMTGMRLLNAPTFLPAYLFSLSGSNAIVGLGLALQQVGGVISPLVGASRVEHRVKVLPSALWIGGIARVMILGIALSGWLIPKDGVAFRLPFLGAWVFRPQVGAILVFLLLFGLFMGAQRVVFNVLMAKVIPISRRGRLQAWRNATGGLIAAVLAYVAGRWFVEPNVLGNGYSTTFLLAFVMTSLGLWILQLLLKEPEPPTVRPPTRLRDRMRDFPRLFQNRSYAFFVGVQMLATSARIATPFYILYVGSIIGLDGKTLGLLSLAFLGADTGSNLLWGYLGDKTGFRLVLLLSLLAWVGATVLLMNVHGLAPIVGAFVALGAAQAGYQMAAQTMVLEFGARDDLPMRLGVSTSAESFTATIGPVAGGLLAEHLGYGTVFGCSLVFLAIALVLLVTLVQEPRTARRAVL